MRCPLFNRFFLFVVDEYKVSMLGERKIEEKKEKELELELELRRPIQFITNDIWNYWIAKPIKKWIKYKNNNDKHTRKTKDEHTLEMHSIW